VRVAGRVERGSVVREGAERDLLFRVADASGAIPVRFRGPVPDMFQEDREVIVEGWIGAGGTFEAENLLTKCPSKYEGLPAAGHPDGVPAGAAPTSAGPPGS
jgi:cytochrome c-type biogenesis protein CcmE